MTKCVVFNTNYKLLYVGKEGSREKTDVMLFAQYQMPILNPANPNGNLRTISSNLVVTPSRLKQEKINWINISRKYGERLC